MGVFDIKGGSSKFWNFSNSQNPGYMEYLEGTVVEIIYTQKYNVKTHQPEFWPEGDPKMQFHVVLRGRSGQELTWPIDRKSVGVDACLAALDPDGSKSTVSFEELLGKFVRVQTQAGDYGNGRPRPWWVTILGDGEVNMVRGLTDRSPDNKQPHQRQQTPPPPVQQTPPPPVPQQQAPVSQPPVQQQAPSAFHVAQQTAQQAVANQGFQQPAPLVTQVPVETYGADPTGGYYDADIPF